MGKQITDAQACAIGYEALLPSHYDKIDELVREEELSWDDLVAYITKNIIDAFIAGSNFAKEEGIWTDDDMIEFGNFIDYANDDMLAAFKALMEKYKKDAKKS